MNCFLFYLLRRLTPDFRTIADFRKHNTKALKAVFSEFVGICLAMDLYQKELFAINGSKFRAVLQQRIAELRDRKDAYEGYLEQLERTGETQILTTDPEARVMQSKDGYHCYYNVQTAVDDGSHLIASYEAA